MLLIEVADSKVKEQEFRYIFNTARLEKWKEEYSHGSHAHFIGMGPGEDEEHKLAEPEREQWLREHHPDFQKGGRYYKEPEKTKEK